MKRIISILLVVAGFSLRADAQTLLSSITLTGWIVVTNSTAPSGGATNYVYPARSS